MRLGLFDWLAAPKPPPPVRQESMTADGYVIVSLSDLMNSGVEPVDITSDAIIVVDAPEHFTKPVQPVKLGETLAVGAEFGTMRSSFSSMAREEYNAKLRGHQGLRTYDKMRKSDSVVRSALLAVKTPISGATWFVQPAEDTAEAKMHAEFVEKNFFDWMTYTWQSVLNEALLSFDFGYYMFEKVWAIREIDGELRLIYNKLAARHPIDVIPGGWHFDANGGPVAVDLYETPDQPDNVRIPINKLAVFTHGLESGDLTGISMLRPAYKNWFYKENAYKIDAIQKERHGIGIPIIKLPPSFTPQDKALAHELGANLRTNERAHVVLPPNWEIMFAKLEGQPVSALETASHHSQMIYQSVLAQALWDSNSGSAEQMMDLFYKSIRHLAEDVAGVINQYCIPQLIGGNWDTDNFPKLKVRKLGDTAEARTVSFAIRNLVGAGVIQPDDPLEEWAREMIDAPMPDPSSVRQAATPQLAKPPRQSQATNQRISPGGGEGNDGSGG